MSGPASCAMDVVHPGHTHLLALSWHRLLAAGRLDRQDGDIYGLGIERLWTTWCMQMPLAAAGRQGAG